MLEILTVIHTKVKWNRSREELPTVTGEFTYEGEILKYLYMPAKFRTDEYEKASFEIRGIWENGVTYVRHPCNLQIKWPKAPEVECLLAEKLLEKGIKLENLKP